MAAKKFSVGDEPEACVDYRNYQDKLLDFLASKDVQQIAVTRLPLHDGDVTNIRVRLDLESAEKNFLRKGDLKGEIQTLDKESPVNELAHKLCQLLAWKGDPDIVDDSCSRGHMKVTGLVGIDPTIKRRILSKYQEVSLELDKSQFITFELWLD